jgi:hypothetical protein
LDISKISIPYKFEPKVPLTNALLLPTAIFKAKPSGGYDTPPNNLKCLQEEKGVLMSIICKKCQENVIIAELIYLKVEKLKKGITNEKLFPWTQRKV